MSNYEPLVIPTAVEFDDLPNFPNMTITDCGDENLYFTHDGKSYFCKCL